jgi:hypothetical protein
LSPRAISTLSRNLPDVAKADFRRPIAGSEVSKKPLNNLAPRAGLTPSRITSSLSEQLSAT